MQRIGRQLPQSPETVIEEGVNSHVLRTSRRQPGSPETGRHLGLFCNPHTHTWLAAAKAVIHTPSLLS